MMTAKDIDTTAADWAARIDRGPLTVDEDGALAQWIESNPRHRGAFMRMRAIAVHTERARALGPTFDPEKFGNGDARWVRPSRAFKFAYLVAAAATCAAIVIGLRLFGGTDQYETRRGEVKVVSLSDGSVMTLNTASNVEVDFTQGMRSIRLLKGEALFDVAKEKGRPFVVAAGDASVRAIGTSFTVRHLVDKPLEVIVREGVVEVKEATRAAPVRVAAHMRAELSSQRNGIEPKLQVIESGELSRELAWRDGRIAFESETLQQAVAAFARYSEIPIVIDDPVVAGRQITGLFTANDPISFARAAATSLGLKAEVRAGEVHLTR